MFERRIQQDINKI